jgi:glycosyltransferase involved in cell wall biosynthesis
LGALSDLDYAVDLLTFPAGRDHPIPNVRHMRAPNPLGFRSVPVGLSVRKLALEPGFFATARSLLRRNRYDCVHAVEEAAFIALCLCKGDVPVIYDMQSSMPAQLARKRVFRPAPLQRGLRSAERWLLESADTVLAFSGLAAHARAVAPKARVREWNYPAAAAHDSAEQIRDLRNELNIADGSPVVVYTGTFEAYQGLPELLGAIRDVVADVPDTVFVLVGADGRPGEAVAAEARRLGLNGEMRLVQRQPQNRIPAFHAMADVLVAPRAYGSNLPIKIYGYMAAGRPILVSGEVTADNDVLSAERALLTEHSSSSIAAGITRLLRDRPLAERLGAAAQAYADENFRSDRFVDEVRALYDEVIADRRTI